MTAAPPDRGPDYGTKRLPPQDVEIEKAVLGAMMLSDNGCEAGLRALQPELFYQEVHKSIFRAISALYEQNVKVDQLTLGNELQRRNQFEKCGGIIYLATLASEVATTANIAYHAQIVAAKGVARFAIEASAQIAERAYAETDTPADLLDWAERKISALAEGKAEEFLPLETVMHGAFAEIDKAHKRDGHVTGVDTGFAELNDMTSGWQSGDLSIIAARPSVGKTALAMCMARNAALEGSGVAIFSLEMSKEQVAHRLLCIESGVDLHQLRTGRLREEDFHQITKNVGRLVQLEIFIDDSAALNILEVRAKSRQLKRRHNIGMIIVDYLQLMSGDRSGNREQEVSSISRGLKALAKDLGVPVIALSQLSRATEARASRKPMLSDLRESGSLEQDADSVFFIFRPELYAGLNKADDMKGKAEIIVAKQRNGPTGSVKLMWDERSASFRSLAPEFRTEG